MFQQGASPSNVAMVTPFVPDAPMSASEISSSEENVAATEMVRGEKVDANNNDVSIALFYSPNNFYDINTNFQIKDRLCGFQSLSCHQSNK